MKHETGSEEFLSSTLDSAHGGDAIFSEYLTTAEFRRGYLDFPPQTEEGRKNCEFVESSMCQDHGLLLFVEPKRFRDFISAGSQSMHMVCEQKHAHLLQSLKKKNIINIPSGQIRVNILNVSKN